MFVSASEIEFLCLFSLFFHKSVRALTPAGTADAEFRTQYENLGEKKNEKTEKKGCEREGRELSGIILSHTLLCDALWLTYMCRVSSSWEIHSCRSHWEVWEWH